MQTEGCEESNQQKERMHLQTRPRFFDSGNVSMAQVCFIKLHITKREHYNNFQSYTEQCKHLTLYILHDVYDSMHLRFGVCELRKTGS